jgi:hypothetical protein
VFCLYGSHRNHTHKTTDKLSDWYSITRQQIIDVGGAGVLTHYTSHVAALMAAWPNSMWDPTRFRVSRHCHRHETNADKRETEEKTNEDRAMMLSALRKAEYALGIKDVGNSLFFFFFFLSFLFFLFSLSSNVSFVPLTPFQAARLDSDHTTRSSCCLQCAH